MPPMAAEIGYRPAEFKTALAFIHGKPFKELSKANRVKCLVRPKILPDLDFAFVTTDDKGGPVLRPLKITDEVSDCIGICIPREDESEIQLEERLKRINEKLKTEHPQIGSYSIVAGPEETLEVLLPHDTLTPLALARYVRAFETIIEERSHTHPTESEDSAEENPLIERVKKLLEQEDIASYLRENGITYKKRGLTDFMFVDSEVIKNDQLSIIGEEGKTGGKLSPARLVNLKNIKIGKRGKDGRLNEALVKEALCAGIYTPDLEQIKEEVLNHKTIGPKIQAITNLAEQEAMLKEEVKIRVYEKAEMIRRSLIHGMKQKVNFQIAIAMDNQINLWDGLGFFEDVAAQFPEAVTPRDVIDYLFYDKEHKRTGPLSQLGITFRTYSPLTDGIDVDPDIVFFKKDLTDGSIYPTGLSLWGQGKNFQPTVYNNVHGLILFPTEMPLTQRKNLTRLAEKALQHWLHDPFATIMGVDANLLAFWKERGSPVVDKETAKLYGLNIGPKRALDYGFSPIINQIDNLSLRIHNPHGLVIGAPMMILKEKYVTDSNHPDIDLKRAIGMEMPWAYPAAHVLSRFPGRPGPAMGMIPYLERDLFPGEPRIYKIDLLKRSINYDSLTAASDISHDGYSFIISELYHRMGWEELNAFIKKTVPQFTEFDSLLQQLEKKDLELYQRKKTIYDLWEFTHGHTDHIQGSSLLRFDIPAAMSPLTYGTQTAAFNSGWTFTGKETVVEKVRGDKKPRPFERLPVNFRPVRFLHDGQPIIANEFTQVTGFDVNHSIPGSMAIRNTVIDPISGRHAVVTNLGDFRRGPLTNRALEILAKDATTLIIESTNFDVNSRKPSTKVTQERAVQNISSEIKNADKTGGFVIVQMPLNDIETLQGIIDQVGDRKVVIPYGMAQLLHELNFLNECQPYEERVDLPQLGEDVFVFKHDIMNYAPWQLQFDPIALTPNDIASDPGGFILLQSPYQLLEKTIKGLRDKRRPDDPELSNGVVIRSAPWPYNYSDKEIVLANYNFLRSVNFAYKTDINLSRGTVATLDDKDITGYHASGHLSTPEEYLDVLAAFAASGNLRQVIPIHTNLPGIFGAEAAGLIEFLKQKEIVTVDIEVVRQMRKKRQMIDIPIPFY